MRISIVILAWFTLLPAMVRGQITVQPLEKTTPNGPVRGFIARIDLNTKNLRIAVTGPVDHAVDHAVMPTGVPAGVPRVVPKDRSTEVNAALVPVDVWAKENHLELAVNANYFGWKPGGGQIIGLLVNDGRTLSPARSWKNQPDPALVFCKQDDGFIGHVTGPGQPVVAAEQIRYAVAGVGGSSSDQVAGSLLVQAGKNSGSSARVSPKQRLARTAAGLDTSGRKLTIVVIDGRQPDWSVGITLPELADLMIGLGVSDAVNLDGGGSSSIVFHKPGQDDFTTNRPCDESAKGRPGVFRAVAVQLGFSLAKAG